MLRNVLYFRRYKHEPVRVVSTRNGPEVGNGTVWSNLQLIEKRIWIAAQVRVKHVHCLDIINR